MFLIWIKILVLWCFGIAYLQFVLRVAGKTVGKVSNCRLSSDYGYLWKIDIFYHLMSDNVLNSIWWTALNLDQKTS